MIPNEEAASSIELALEQEPWSVAAGRLLSRTFQLIWEDPLRLWGPILAADFFKSLILVGSTQLSRALIYRLLPHSVLSGQPDLSLTNRLLPLIGFVSGLIRLLGAELAFFAYATAFILVARTVQKLTAPSDETAVVEPRSILKSALKLSLILTGLAIVFIVILVFATTAQPLHRFLSTSIVTSLEMAIITSLEAIVVARPFLRATSRNSQRSRRFTTRTTMLAWTALALGETLSLLLSAAVSNASIPMPSTPTAGYFQLRALVLSLVTALPYIPMIIGITLLAEEAKPQAPNESPLIAPIA
jgi:hypothetical protein